MLDIIKTQEISETERIKYVADRDYLTLFVDDDENGSQAIVVLDRQKVLDMISILASLL